MEQYLSLLVIYLSYRRPNQTLTVAAFFESRNILKVHHLAQELRAPRGTCDSFISGHCEEKLCFKMAHVSTEMPHNTLSTAGNEPSPAQTEPRANAAGELLPSRSHRGCPRAIGPPPVCVAAVPRSPSTFRNPVVAKQSHIRRRD